MPRPLGRIPLPPHAASRGERAVDLLLGRTAMELLSKLGGPLVGALGLGRLIVAGSTTEKNLWTLLGLTGVAVSGGAAFRIWRMDRRSLRVISDLTPLHGVLRTLHAALTEYEETSADRRVCLYAPAPGDVSPTNSAEVLHRVTPYFGAGGPHDPPGRRTLSTAVGAVGMSYREDERVFVRCAPGEDRMALLTRGFGFTREAAAAVREDRRSWAAVPLGDTDGGVSGVLFADSDDPDFFGAAGDHPRQRILLAAAVAALEFSRTYYAPDRKKFR